MDLCAAVETDLVLPPEGRIAVPTGLAMAIDPDHEVQLRPRSGLALKHGVTLANAPGTIDSDYRGEVKVILINHAAERFTVERGMRIAQMVVAPVTQIDWMVAEALPETQRGGGGFGSTGI